MLSTTLQLRHQPISNHATERFRRLVISQICRPGARVHNTSSGRSLRNFLKRKRMEAVGQGLRFIL